MMRYALLLVHLVPGSAAAAGGEAAPATRPATAPSVTTTTAHGLKIAHPAAWRLDRDKFNDGRGPAYFFDGETFIIGVVYDVLPPRTSPERHLQEHIDGVRRFATGFEAQHPALLAQRDVKVCKCPGKLLEVEISPDRDAPAVRHRLLLITFAANGRRYEVTTGWQPSATVELHRDAILRTVEALEVVE